MNKLTKLFYRLVSIPSPSGEELAVGNFIKSYLKDIGVEANFDNTGLINQSNSGNLIAKLEGKKKLPTLLFVAHMDTVEVGGISIRPKIVDGVIKSAGKTILGADNKGSVAALLEALKEISLWNFRPTIIAVFSTREENGQMGISLLNLPDKIDFAFNIDGQGPTGRFVNKTLGEIPFEIKLFGKAVHAAVDPEKGINAIKAAGLIITQLKIGKDKKGNVLNIGRITGGKANNIVPDEVILEGQVRAFTEVGLAKSLTEIEKVIKSVCKRMGCSYEFIARPEKGAPPFSLTKNHKIIQIAKSATKSLELPFFLETGSFTCEANFLTKKYTVLNVCRGGQMPHSTSESITVKELKQLKDLIKELARRSSL